MKALLAVNLKEPPSFLETVQNLSEQFGIELYVLHVGVAEPVLPNVYDTTTGLVGFSPYLTYDPGIGEGFHEAQHQAFKQFLTDNFKHPINASYQEGDPVEIILRDAEEKQVDLVIIGKKHQTTLERLIVGSVAGKIFHRTKIPTLLIPLQ